MLKNIFGGKTSQRNDNKTIIVVSGLPRSGTSMMMKMLEEGGIPILTDAIRGADNDNPNGYYEFELVKKLPDGPNQWLADANHKAVKIISALLEHLPASYRYKIIFMEREPREILASQQKMLANRNEKSEISDTEMQEQFQKHLAAIKYWLARQPNMDVMYVDYNKMISKPENFCQAIADFIAIPVDVSKMLAVPNERLYRNRATKP
jgi:lipopolysaccharide export LptBFGC system permease protein LptF